MRKVLQHRRRCLGHSERKISYYLKILSLLGPLQRRPAASGPNKVLLRRVGCRDCGVDAVVAPRMGESLPRGGRQVSTIMRFCQVYAGLRGSVAVSWSVDRAFPRSTLHQAES